MKGSGEAEVEIEVEFIATHHLTLAASGRISTLKFGDNGFGKVEQFVRKGSSKVALQTTCFCLH